MNHKFQDWPQLAGERHPERPVPDDLHRRTTGSSWPRSSRPWSGRGPLARCGRGSAPTASTSPGSSRRCGWPGRRGPEGSSSSRTSLSTPADWRRLRDAAFADAAVGRPDRRRRAGRGPVSALPAIRDAGGRTRSWPSRSWSCSPLAAEAGAEPRGRRCPPRHRRRRASGPEGLDAVDAIVRGGVADGAFPGAVLAIGRRGSLVRFAPSGATRTSPAPRPMTTGHDLRPRQPHQGGGHHHRGHDPRRRGPARPRRPGPDPGPRRSAAARRTASSCVSC